MNSIVDVILIREGTINAQLKSLNGQSLSNGPNITGRPPFLPTNIGNMSSCLNQRIIIHTGQHHIQSLKRKRFSRCAGILPI